MVALYLMVLNYDLAVDGHISIYYVFAQRSVRVAYVLHMHFTFVLFSLQYIQYGNRT